jgi:hypothetical protein
MNPRDRSEWRHTDRQHVTARLASRFHELYGDSSARPSDHDLRMLADEAFDVVAGDHRTVGRFFPSNQAIPVTVRVATQDSERTVQIWGRVTGWSITTSTAEITSLEITRARVHDVGLHQAMVELRDLETRATNPTAQATLRTVLDLLERLQPPDRTDQQPP